MMERNTWEEQTSEKDQADRGNVITLVVGVCSLVGLAVAILIVTCMKRSGVLSTTGGVLPLQTPEGRLKQLDKALPPAVFSRWYRHDQKNHPGPPPSQQEAQVCVICLDAMQAQDSIRALKCGHIYHRQCFDRWFTGSHDYCPLCHRLVLPPTDASEVV
ncbi:hypothetical protein BDW02DRAFT_235035 [Decorospora gaudefroyi]|uniref:RING-type domain-containing protein n=1 Tax=Decorospora gaudefroyi TaxID=184978 RepID=A0A6A5KX34_9PLEO|nr:hypothetical protein BDW02DRAFT_235035 [Decorospora gaudefroyi]